MIQTVWICSVAWIVPGAGHMMLKKWRRGVVFLVALMVLFICGLIMESRRNLQEIFRTEHDVVILPIALRIFR